MKNLLLAGADGAVAQWVEDSFPIIRIVFVALIALLSISMIVLVLCQQSNSRGISAVTGGSDTYYTRNKGKSLQGQVKKLSIINACLLLGFCFIYLIIYSIYSGV